MANLVTLSNNGYTLQISPLGAEIKSFRNREGQEIFWQNLPDEKGNKIWDRTAPNLFPMTGPSTIIEKGEKLKGFYRLEGRKYPMPQHGFIRDTMAEIIWASPNEATFVIRSSDETRKIYPFEFNYFVEYRLNDKGRVRKIVCVENLNNIAMPFNIGDHEAFALNDDISKYYVRFDKPEKNDNKLITTKGDKSVINLSKEMFANDSVPFYDLQSKYVTLLKRNKDRKDKEIATITLNSPVFLLWSKPPFKFICPEPRHGKPLESKENENAKFMNVIAPGETYRLERNIVIHKGLESVQEKESNGRFA
jgi:galactose mutarotase-like enzyme